MCLVRISRVSDPTVGLHQSSWAEVFILVPPVGWTRGRATRAEDALVETVKFLAILGGLKELSLRRRIVILEVGLNRLVLLVE